MAYSIGPIGSGLISLITLPMITWFYSVEDVGRISMLQVCTSFFVLLFSLGLDQAYVREYHESLNKPQLLKVVLLPSLIISITVLSIVYLYDSLIVSQWLYGIASHYLSIISMSCFLVALVARYLSLILRMQEKALAFSMSQLLPKILFLIFVLCVVYLGFATDSYSLITANALSLFAAFVVYLWNTKCDWLPIFKEKFDWSQFKISLAFGLPLVIGGLASWGLNVMDRIFLRNMSTYTELGVYSVAMSIAGVAALFSGIFNTIWAPMVFKWVSEGNIDYNKIDDISEYVLAAIYFLVVLSGLFSWIIPIFLPKSYVEIQFIITACILGPLFYTLSETTAVGIAIARKTKFAVLASIVAMLVNLMANYFLVPLYGAKGAAISTAIAFWVYYIFRTEFSRIVWRKMPAGKSYWVSFGLLIVAIQNALLSHDFLTSYSIWFFALIIGFYLFRKTILECLKILRFFYF